MAYKPTVIENYSYSSEEDGKVSVNLMSDDSFEWVSPPSPSIAVHEKALGHFKKDVGILAELKEVNEAINGDKKVIKGAEGKTVAKPFDILTKLYNYLDPKYKDAPLSLIPKELIAEAWNKYKADAMKNRSFEIELDTNALNVVTDLAFVSSGAGGYFNQIQTFLSQIDRFNGNILPINTEYSGMTFITRPRLCLQSSNLRSNRRMTPLDTKNPRSMAFMLRALLDTNLGKINDNYTSTIAACPLLDKHNPFLTPLINSLTSINGWPDISIQTQTTEGGYMCEAQQFAIGGDDFNRGTYNLNLSFKDIQHGPVSALFYYWLEYIRCVTRGTMLAYADDIDEQRLNYTVSIYRFTLDPSRTYIVHWAKATGCFPTGLPTGSIVQVNEGETFVGAASTLNVPFVANKIEYQDYAILMEFNALMRRYCPSINQDKDKSELEPSIVTGRQEGTLVQPNLPRAAITNFRGLPYITSDPQGYRLEFRRSPSFGKFDTKDTASWDVVDRLMFLDMQKQVAEFSSDGTSTAITELSERFTPEIFAASQTYFDKGNRLYDPDNPANSLINRILSKQK